MTNKESAAYEAEAAEAAELPLLLLELGKFQAQEKFHDELLCELQNRAATFPADLQQALAEFAEILAETKRLQARGPRGKTKSGRPGTWKSVEGLRLIEAVEEIRANKHCSIARALGLVINTDPRFKDHKPTCRRDDRALQARYQEAVKYWSFLRGSYLKEAAAMNVRQLAAIERFRMAHDRWKASLEVTQLS
jgi:hypothetical protein